MTELEKLIKRLSNPSIKNFNIFPGDVSYSPETLAREVNKALDQIEAGQSTMTTSFKEVVEGVSIEEWMKRASKF